MAMIEVAAAIIENEHNQLLIARRKLHKSQGGLWEFPGGKLEGGESIEVCLKRELLEEMNINIEPYQAFGINEHDYGSLHIRLHAYRAKFISGELELHDHDEYIWVYPHQLNQYQFAPADIKFVNQLISEHG